MKCAENRQKRKDNISVRLARLINLRKLGAPKWIIKTEQIALVLNAKGKKNYGIGSDFSKEQEQLYKKHVKALLEGSEDE